METRIALMGIIVEDIKKSEEVNKLLHQYGDYVVGRMGVPYKKRDISIISVVLDAPNDEIASLSGKIGMIEGVSVKTQFSKAPPVVEGEC